VSQGGLVEESYTISDWPTGFATFKYRRKKLSVKVKQQNKKAKYFLLVLSLQDRDKENRSKKRFFKGKVGKKTAREVVGFCTDEKLVHSVQIGGPQD